MSGKINNTKEAEESFDTNILDNYNLMLKYPSKKSKINKLN